MNQESDGRALIIYIGAITLVGLLIVFGSIISFTASGRNDEAAKVSTEVKP
jgi:heme A synthase